jgi:hypothetical protein
MAYGDYSDLDKPNKGVEGGACNRSSCQAEPALWFNHGSLSWYCADCRRDIQFDRFNLRDWEMNWQPTSGHPMFETRAQIDARLSPPPIIVVSAADGPLTKSEYLDSLPMKQMMDRALEYLERSPDPIETSQFFKRERTAPRPRDLYSQRGYKGRLTGKNRKH